MANVLMFRIHQARIVHERDVFSLRTLIPG